MWAAQAFQAEKEEKEKQERARIDANNKATAVTVRLMYAPTTVSNQP